MGKDSLSHQQHSRDRLPAGRKRRLEKKDGLGKSQKEAIVVWRSVRVTQTLGQLLGSTGARKSLQGQSLNFKGTLPTIDIF